MSKKKTSRLKKEPEQRTELDPTPRCQLFLLKKSCPCESKTCTHRQGNKEARVAIIERERMTDGCHGMQHGSTVTGQSVFEETSLSVKLLEEKGHI